MNKKAEKFNLKTIRGYEPKEKQSDTDMLIDGIIQKTTKSAVNKIDEVTVMHSMLNDKDFSIEFYDKKSNNTEFTSPRKEALDIANSVLTSVTGMSTSEAEKLTENYEFSKKDAQRFINISKGFVDTYLRTGRKTTIVSNPKLEATLSLKYVEGHIKKVPDRDNAGVTKSTEIPEHLKIVVSNKR